MAPPLTASLLSQDQLTKLKVPDLKALCRERNLAVSGNKAALVERLKLYQLNSTSALPARPVAPTASPALPASISTSPPATSQIVNNATTLATSTKCSPSAALPSLPSYEYTKGTIVGSIPPTVPPVSASPPASRPLHAGPAAAPLKRLVSSDPVQQVKRLRPNQASTAQPFLAGSSKFQTLRPLQRSTLTSCPPNYDSVRDPVTASRPTLDMRHIAAQYSWMLPVLGHSTFQDFLPAAVTSDSLQAALAYLLTRAYLTLNVDESETAIQLATALPVVLSVDCLMPEVYRLRLANDTEHVFISATGEIVSSDGKLRSDWTAYMPLNTDSSAQIPISRLISLVRSQDEESYESGISKAFRTRLAAMPDKLLARELLAIAESYVLAHVAPNAISGIWQSVHSQCAEFQGITQEASTWAKAKRNLAFFLPEVHHVESVSVASLHPSLAIVQNPHRAHFVLRHTGQIIGEEDEGVFPLFCELLCCKADGRAKQQ